MKVKLAKWTQYSHGKPAINHFFTPFTCKLIFTSTISTVRGSGDAGMEKVGITVIDLLFTTMITWY